MISSKRRSIEPGGSLSDRMTRMRGDEGDTEFVSPLDIRSSLPENDSLAENDIGESGPRLRPTQPNSLEEAQYQIIRLQSQLTQARAELALAHQETPPPPLSPDATEEAIRVMLPIIDDLDDALAHVPELLWGDAWVAGVLFVGDRIVSLLQDSGVDRLAPIHQPFDPRLHEAVATLEGAALPEHVAHNTVTVVYRPGYMYRQKVLRPAQVQVAIRKGR